MILIETGLQLKRKNTTDSHTEDLEGQWGTDGGANIGPIEQNRFVKKPVTVRRGR